MTGFARRVEIDVPHVYISSLELDIVENWIENSVIGVSPITVAAQPLPSPTGSPPGFLLHDSAACRRSPSRHSRSPRLQEAHRASCFTTRQRVADHRRGLVAALHIIEIIIDSVRR